jgi:hypothetical protein
MSKHDSDHVQMQIECPNCHKKMFLHVGLASDTDCRRTVFGGRLINCSKRDSFTARRV